MYEIVKKIIKKLLPKKIIFEHEGKFRSITYLFFTGDKFECTICEKKLRSFINLENGDKLCPYCGSLSRDRRLWEIVNQEFLTQGMKILDFSPSRSLFKRFKKLDNIYYFSSDLSGDFLADYHYNITKMDVEDGLFDLIICYHILEHVEHDIVAMRELYRVLKAKGSCLIQTPFKEGDIYEDPNIISEKDRLKHFGQEDHLRIYSIKGLVERLVGVGLKVETRNYLESEENKYGFKNLENILVCKK